jgi:phage terminase small subunit
MVALRNPKHERFAQELAKGKAADAAYEAAGYKPDRGNATRLHQKDSISHRVAELLAEREAIHAQSTAKAVERAALTKQWVIERLVENVDRAMQVEEIRKGDAGTGEYRYEGAVANRALELLGKELGMFVERREVGEPGDFDRMADDELRDELRAQAAELGLPVDATQH